MRALQPNLRGTNIKLGRLLQTAIALELLSPSKNIYLHVRELSDTLVLPNATGEFSFCLPSMELELLSLSQVLTIFALKGTQVFIRYDIPISNIMRSKLTHPNIQLEQDINIYPPGWIGEKYVVSGSIRFMRDQITLDDNEVTFITEELAVHSTILNAQETW